MQRWWLRQRKPQSRAPLGVPTDADGQGKPGALASLNRIRLAFSLGACVAAGLTPHLSSVLRLCVLLVALLAAELTARVLVRLEPSIRYESSTGAVMGWRSRGSAALAVGPFFLVILVRTRADRRVI